MSESASPSQTQASRRPIGQRKLAAVVFTDVVGFSARVQANEALTLRLVQRDFSLMSDACKTAGGEVLKNTGDGLLMWFPTASAAVGWALRVQKHLALTTKAILGFRDGQYATFVVRGDVNVQIKNEKGPNALLCAVFFDPEGNATTIPSTTDDVRRPRRPAAQGPAGRRR